MLYTATLIDRVLVFCFRSARGSTKHRQLKLQDAFAMQSWVPITLS